MHEMLPNVQLIYLVRDPIERTLSHYTHSRIKRREKKSVNEALCPSGKSWSVNVSRYYFQLSQYLPYYSKENILVIQSERLRESRDEVMAEVFRFIGVAPHLDRSDGAFAEEYNETAGKEQKTSMAALLTETALGRAAKNAGKRLLPQRTIEWAKEALWSEVEKPTLDDHVRARVQNYLHDDVEQLRALAGKEFRGWSV